MSRVKAAPAFLTREEIDQVIAGMSASDLIEAMGEDETRVKGTKMMGAAFDSAAARLGLSNGSPATQHVKLQDFKYLAETLGKAVNIESPLSEGQQP